MGPTQIESLLPLMVTPGILFIHLFWSIYQSVYYGIFIKTIYFILSYPIILLSPEPILIELAIKTLTHTTLGESPNIFFKPFSHFHLSFTLTWKTITKKQNLYQINHLFDYFHDNAHNRKALIKQTWWRRKLFLTLVHLDLL